MYIVYNRCTMGMIDSIKDQVGGVMSSVTEKPFAWIDAAESNLQKRIRTAVVCSGMIALGLVIISLSLAMQGVIGPKAAGGFDPGNFSLDMSSAPIMAIGVTLIAGGIGFAINRGISGFDDETKQKVANIAQVVSVVCGAVALGVFLTATFHSGYISAACHSTQFIVAHIATGLFIIYVLHVADNYVHSASFKVQSGTVVTDKKYSAVTSRTQLDNALAEYKLRVQSQNLN